MMYLMPRNE